MVSFVLFGSIVHALERQFITALLFLWKKFVWSLSFLLLIKIGSIACINKAVILKTKHSFYAIYYDAETPFLYSTRVWIAKVEGRKSKKWSSLFSPFHLACMFTSSKLQGTAYLFQKRFLFLRSPNSAQCKQQATYSNHATSGKPIGSAFGYRQIKIEFKNSRCDWSDNSCIILYSWFDGLLRSCLSC
jgi:hypothetical protein